MQKHADRIGQERLEAQTAKTIALIEELKTATAVTPSEAKPTAPAWVYAQRLHETRARLDAKRYHGAAVMQEPLQHAFDILDEDRRARLFDQHYSLADELTKLRRAIAALSG